MSEKATICDVLDWSIAPWCPTLVLPTDWLNENREPADRGPFHAIHCGDHDTALHVCELMNEEVMRVMRVEGLTP